MKRIVASCWWENFPPIEARHRPQPIAYCGFPLLPTAARLPTAPRPRGGAGSMKAREHAHRAQEMH